jgi:hypothetical protein
MADLRFCLKAGAGFALVAGLSSVALAEGGEDPFSAVAIGGFPFADTGDTSDNLDDFDAVCPFSGSTSNDVWYSFTGNGGGYLLNLCDSGYDTKIYVLDAGFAVVACNDDSCGSDGFRSQTILSSSTNGATYFVAVDGYGGSNGSYILSMEEYAGCDVVCDGDALDENEPCGSDTNGGCNASPNNFYPLVPGDTVCGSMWADGSTRDTDWYSITHGGGVINWSADSEVPLALFVLTPGCAGITLLAIGDTGGLCGSGLATGDFAAGDYTLWAGAGGVGGAGIFDGYPCVDNNTYQASYEGVLPCPYDLDDSGDVGFGDLLLILSNWGPCP